MLRNVCETGTNWHYPRSDNAETKNCYKLTFKGFFFFFGVCVWGGAAIGVIHAVRLLIIALIIIKQ